MKPYFTKYLPVEVEIKEGEPFDTIVGIYGKKMKLFLCSRDIQVGDTFHSFSGMSELKWDGKFQLHPDDFKVIGEISNEATWVKEGDEFDESEIKIIQRPKYKENWKSFPFKGKNKRTGSEFTIYPHSLSFGGNEWEILNPVPEQLLVKIKCHLCEYFH